MAKKFSNRIASIYAGMKRRTEEKRFKTGRNAGRIMRHGIALPFTAKELEQWLLSRRGSPDTPFQCHYCSVWITLMTCAIDHKVPLRFGGGAGFDNLDDICQDCNNVKGGALPDSLEGLLAFFRVLGITSPRCANDFHNRLKNSTAFAKERKRFMAQRKQEAVTVPDNF